MPVQLRCPVRGCGEPLNRDGARWTCARNHSFDQNRRGFVNLLQPQDRKSQNPGDSREAALARRRLAGLGHADPVHRALRHAIRSRSEGRPAAVLDVGCGEGAFLASLANFEGLERHGVDISAPAVEMAARAHPGALFVVANADRTLPYAERSFDFITSIDSRAPTLELDRTLRVGGLILVAVPGPDDLVELRERIQGTRVEKARTSRVQEQLGSLFALADTATIRETRTLAPDSLRDLLISTYRGFRQSERAAAEGLDSMSVTLSHEILAFERR